MRPLAWLGVVTLAGLVPLAGCRTPPARLVLLVSVDTLRADRLGAYGSTLGLTPRLDRFASEGVVFETTYAAASFTLPSLGALLTSRYPEEIGIAGNSTVLAAGAPVLAGALGNRGFRTAAVVSNYVLRPASGFGAGFETYDATFPQREALRPVPERTAPETTAAALRALDALRATGGDRLFLWVHYQDPHGPYAPPDALRSRALETESKAPDAARVLPVSKTQSGDGAIPRYQYFDGHADPAFYRAGYDGEVAYVDDAIGRLFDGVATRGLLEKAVVVFTADHGEGLGEDDYWFSHGERLGDPLVRVPLVIHAPGIAAGRRGDTASLLDVAPTIAARIGVALAPGARGRDLFAPGAARDASTVYMTTLRVSDTPRRGVVSRGLKYVIERTPAGDVEHLSALGAESRELSASRTDDLGRMRRELAAAMASLRKVGSAEQALSPEDRERFNSLGYVEGR